jgi:hypothetical protein
MQIKRAQHGCFTRVRRWCSVQVSVTCILLLSLLLGKWGGHEEFSILITKKIENYSDRLQAGRSRNRFQMMSLEIFIDIILPASMDLGWTQLLTEMSTRNISLGWRWSVRRADRLNTFLCRFYWNLETLTSWNRQGLSRPVEDYFTFTLTFSFVRHHDWLLAVPSKKKDVYFPTLTASLIGVLTHITPACHYHKLRHWNVVC